MIRQGWLYYIFVSSLFVPPLNLTLTINEVTDYDKEDHHLYFLNKIISNLNQYLLHVYLGVSKKCCLYIISNTSIDLITDSVDLS